MDKREQELRQKVADLKAKAEGFNNSGKYEDAKAKKLRKRKREK